MPSCRWNSWPVCLVPLLSALRMLPVADSIDCFQQPPTTSAGNYYPGNLNVFTCPGSTTACYKYVCVGNVYYVQRGCLDPLSPTQRCEVIQGQCMAQGGVGTCYTCSNNRCNGAPSPVGPSARIWAIFTALAVAMAAELI